MKYIVSIKKAIKNIINNKIFNPTKIFKMNISSQLQASNFQSGR